MTPILSLTHPECVPRIVDVIKRGGIVCLPTETVYGLVCSTQNQVAIRRVANLKGRPQEKPFALFCSSWERMAREALEENLLAKSLAHHFWPGPLTLVLAARPSCPGYFRGSVGVRCPAHDFVQAVLAACGGLLMNTSLNRSGQPECRSIAEAGDMLKEIDLAIDDGALPYRLPSTVLDCRMQPPLVLREGGIAGAEIAKVIQELG